MIKWTASNVKDGSSGSSFWFWCPGCVTNHRFVIKNAAGETGPEWTFNGDVKSPTFSPSLHYNSNVTPEDLALGVHRCHLFLKAGMVQYLGDCTHSFKGKTIPVEDSTM